MTPRQRLQTLLDGGTPDAPPHWELVFQIPLEFFGLDPATVHAASYSSESDHAQALYGFHSEVGARLIEECHWAAMPAADAYSPAAVRATKEALGNLALIPGYEGAGVFWLLPGSEVMDFVVKLFERPEELNSEARQKCDAAKERLRALADAGADFFVGTYDFGFNDAPFISPDHFRQFVTPYLTEIVETAHDLGKVMILHSDGCLTQILDQIHATGIDGYQSVDPQGHMDIGVVREQYPDWLLMGNVNCSMMQEGPEEEIRRSVRACMDEGGVGKRYILSTSNCIFHGMPPENYRIMLDEYRACLARAGAQP